MRDMRSVAFLALCSLVFNNAAASEAPFTPPSGLSANLAEAPTYLYRDKGGAAYALQVDVVPTKQGVFEYRFWKRYLSSQHFFDVQLQGARIEYLPDLPINADGIVAKSAYQCTDATAPSDFNIWSTDGVNVYGNVFVCATNKPANASTQWANFVLFSSNYENQAAHTFIPLWFKNSLHGHGMYFGDTDSYPCANGDPATYNTRIEAWSQWYVPGTPTPGPYWTSTGPWMTDTCGAPLSDGWNIPIGVVSTQFNVTLHASSGQWVQYSVDRWDGSAWVTHTPPVVRNMTYSSWTTPGGPGVFDPTASGIAVASTQALGVARGGTWHIGIRALRTGWF